MRIRTLAFYFALFTVSTQNAFAVCLPKEVIALSASGYSKMEIDDLCRNRKLIRNSGPSLDYHEVAIAELPKDIL